MRKVWILLPVVGVVGAIVFGLLAALSDDYKAYGEVPIPGSERLHLPEGDVMISFHAIMPDVQNYEKQMPLPQNLELVITAPSGAEQPTVSEDLGSTFAGDSEAHRQVKVAHIVVAGDYTITTNGTDNPSVSPRLSFGHGNHYKLLLWISIGLAVFGGAISTRAMKRRAHTASDAGGRPDVSDAGGRPDVSVADLLSSGQRVRGVLRAFRDTGATMRSQGLTPSRQEFLDYPYYALKVELRLPDRPPVTGRIQQPVPPTEVPNLAVGRELNCAVDPADPKQRFVVDFSTPPA
ncbi:hypothetical protein [Mycolicibacterium gadium]|uniref:DUF3592 domain-containing protein n=1 Tax=Mycolicibacterium gadium TaxID=1794 RepID=A0ABT6GIT4_MYCGU|nr:hypothetical protein [Mycolicibacterium gadium]MDG5481288.1 hypothetical protein [Mycolicibacterium gadium]